MTRLTSRQTRQLATKLETMRSTSLGLAHETLVRAEEDAFVTLAGEVPDFSDQATATSLIDFEHELARRNADAIRQVDDALSRIGSRRFGSCIDCGDDIGFARLMAFPTAQRCVTCQGLHERTYAVGATPSL
jgi:RNA polymerase-binding transcription factor